MNILIKLVGTTLLFTLFSQLSHATNVVGKTMVARGQVEAKSTTDDNGRKLKRRSEVFNSDVIITGDKSKAQLRMLDGGMIALKENSELVIAQYDQNANGDKGSVVLNLVEGGLRSITGAIKADKGDYQLNTSIGSIGIRGTHYEVQVIDGVLWLAVWDGAIDVILNVGDQAGSTLSLGINEDYAYGSIDEAGNVTTYIESPKIFQQGFSSDPKKESSLSSTEEISQPTTTVFTPQSQQLNANQLLNDFESEQRLITAHDDIPAPGQSSIYDLVSEREGSISYNDVAFTSESNLTDFALGMDINFTSGEVSNGELSFNDDKENGQWNAVFNGNVNITDTDVFIEVGVTEASHGNNVVDGIISTSFVEALGLGSIVGDIELYDAQNDVSVNAAYQVKDKE